MDKVATLQSVARTTLRWTSSYQTLTTYFFTIGAGVTELLFLAGGTPDPLVGGELGWFPTAIGITGW